MSMALVTTESGGDKAAQGWPCPSLAAILGRKGLATLHYAVEWALHLSRAAKQNFFCCCGYN